MDWLDQTYKINSSCILTANNLAGTQATHFLSCLKYLWSVSFHAQTVINPPQVRANESEKKNERTRKKKKKTTIQESSVFASTFVGVNGL